MNLSVFLFVSLDIPLRNKLAFFSFYFHCCWKQVIVENNIALKKKTVKLISLITLKAKNTIIKNKSI